MDKGKRRIDGRREESGKRKFAPKGRQFFTPSAARMGSTVSDGETWALSRCGASSWSRTGPDLKHISQQIGVPGQLDRKLSDQTVRWTDEQRTEDPSHCR